MTLPKPAAAVLGGCLALTTAAAPATDFTWIAGGGLWLNTGFWNPVSLPGGPTTSDNVFITNDLLVETVTITQNAGANAITLSDGGIVRIADSIILNDGVDFTFAGGGFVNDGHFMQNGLNADTFVQFLGSQTIAGRGEWVMGDSSNNRIIGNGGELKHGNGFGHELRGAGQLLANTMSLWNLETIRQQGSNALVIDPNGNGVDNDGLIVAEGAGGLTLTGGTFDNTTGVIRAADAATTRLQSSTFIGGVLDTTGSGELSAINATLDGVTINGTLRQLNGNKTTVVNGVTNNGTWTLEGADADTYIQFNGAQTIGGSGEIVLGDSANNRIISNQAQITIGAGQTIRGAGELGDNSASIVNQGTVRATGATRLVIDVNGFGFDQDGVLRAEGTGGLRLTSSEFRLNNAVELLAGSALLIDNAIVSGTIDVAAGEQVDLQNNTLAGVTLSGDARQDNGWRSTVTGGITNDGTWTLEGTDADTYIQFNGTQTIGGTGEIVLGDSANNRIISNGSEITIGAGQTIRGAGQLGANSASFVNQGSIRATEATELVIDANGFGFDQDGVLRAEGAGGLRLTSSEFRLNNAVELLAGSALLIDNATVSGTIDVAAGEQVDLQNNTLAGVTLSGDARQDNGWRSTVTGGITNDGTWTLEGTDADTYIQFNGTQTIGGTGKIVLGDSANNRIISNGSEITIGAGQTIRGAGQLGANSASFVNQGIVAADAANTALTIDANANGFVNQGTLIASGAGGLVSIGDLVQTAGQTIVSSQLDLLSNGDLEINGGSLSGSGQINGDVVNTGGTVNAGDSPGTLTIAGDYAQGPGGTLLVEIAGTGAGLFDVLLVGGQASLDGTLAVSLIGTPTIGIGDTFDVLVADTIVGAFDNAQVSAGSALFDIAIIDGVSDIVRLTSLTAVPLPAPAWLLLGALPVLAARRRPR